MKKLASLLLGSFLALAWCLQSQALDLKQSTSQTLIIGPFVDSTDGNTAETGLTIAAADVLLSKNGGTLTAKNSGGCTHDADGWYACTLNTTDTNTAGLLQLKVHVAGALAVFREYRVVPAVNFAALYETAPGATGGMVQVGANGAMSFTGAAASGATPATPAFLLTGGAASTTGGGVAAPGWSVVGGAGAASTNGAAEGFRATGGGTTTVSGAAGLVASATGNLSGGIFNGAGTGHGLLGQSGAGATGNGIQGTSLATNGSGNGGTGTGTGNGYTGIGGSTSGEGANYTGGGTGDGVRATSGGGASGDGIAAVAASTNGNGESTAGAGTGRGTLNTGGATGEGTRNVGGSSSGAGMANVGSAGNSVGQANAGQGSAAGQLNTGGTTGAGQSSVGGATSGAGVLATGTAGNSPAMSLVGQGSASGLLATGGATGEGARYVGGATSGNAIGTSITAPIGPVPEQGIIESGTLQSATGTTAVLRSATSFADDYLNCTFMEIIGGTGTGLRNTISDWTNTSPADTATFDTAWTTTLDNTSKYIVWGTPCATAGSAPSAGTVAAAVWDLDATGHQTQGTFGQAIGDPGADTDTIFALTNSAAATLANLQAATWIFSGTADTGSTATALIDAALTQSATDYWAKNVAVVITNGATAGETACITAFNTGSDQLTLGTPLTAAIGTSTYTLIPAPACDPFR